MREALIAAAPVSVRAHITKDLRDRKSMPLKLGSVLYKTSSTFTVCLIVVTRCV